MATVLVQTEDRPKTTNGAHAVSNFMQRRLIATRFPEKIDDISKMLHLPPCNGEEGFTHESLSLFFCSHFVFN